MRIASCDFCGERRAWLRSPQGDHLCEGCMELAPEPEPEREPDERLELSENERAIGAEAL